MSSPKYHMKWHSWKMGLLVSALTGLLMGVVTLGAAPEVTIRQLAIILAVNIAKDMLLFLKEHPIDQATLDTELLRRQNEKKTGNS